MNHPKESIVKKFVPRVVCVFTLAAGAVVVAAVSLQMEQIATRRWS